MKTCGIVTTRQHQETAKGTTFISLEDETGEILVIVHRDICERQRKEMLGTRLMLVKGTWQRNRGTTNLIAGYLEDLTPMLGKLKTASRTSDELQSKKGIQPPGIAGPGGQPDDRSRLEAAGQLWLVTGR